MRKRVPYQGWCGQAWRYECLQSSQRRYDAYPDWYSLLRMPRGLERHAIWQQKWHLERRLCPLRNDNENASFQSPDHEGPVCKGSFWKVWPSPRSFLVRYQASPQKLLVSSLIRTPKMRQNPKYARPSQPRHWYFGWNSVTDSRSGEPHENDQNASTHGRDHWEASSSPVRAD